jgi:hypothetical protein
MNMIAGKKASEAGTMGSVPGYRPTRPARPSRAMWAALAIASLAAVSLPACVSPSPEPDFHVSGLVLDARTGTRIAGATVSDTRWGERDPRGAVSLDDGSFGYFTWFEAHEIVASAEGYRPASRLLDTFVVGRSPVVVIEFELEPLEGAGASIE